MSNKPRQSASLADIAPGADIVAVALIDREELANLTTGFKRMYALPDSGDFDDLLMAIENASKTR